MVLKIKLPAVLGRFTNPLREAVMSAFENIKPGSRLRGLDSSGLAEVVQVTQFGPGVVCLKFCKGGDLGLVYAAGAKLG